MRSRISRLLSSYATVAILILALFLRLFYFFGVMRGDDLAYSYYAYYTSQGAGEIIALLPGADRIGLYFPVALLYRVFGYSEFVSVTFPLLSSIATVFFVYKITQIIANKRAGLLAALLWSVFPLDVFLSTQLLPDGPSAMATSGTILFFLFAMREKGVTRRLACIAVSAVFGGWAYLIKTSTLPVVFVVLGILLLELIWPYLPSIRETLRKKWLLICVAIMLVGGIALVSWFEFVSIQSIASFENKVELTSTDVSSALVLGRANPVLYADLGAGFWDIEHQPYHPEPLLNALTEPYLGERIRVFDPYLIGFFIALAYLVFSRNKSSYVPALWFSILFFFLEWGSYSFSLRAYLPVIYWVDARNFLFVAIPMIIVIALFLSSGLENSNPVNLIVIPSVSTVIVAIGLAGSFSSYALSFIDYCFSLLLVLAITSPFVLKSTAIDQNIKQGVFLGLVTLMSVTALRPSTHYHVYDFFKEEDRRENLKNLNAELEELPARFIYAGSDSIEWLDYYSGFEYGYNYDGSPYSSPESRLTDDILLIKEVGGYVISEGCNQPVSGMNDWPLASFGDLESTNCFSLIEILPESEADVRLAQAKGEANHSLTQEDIETYITSAAKANNMSEFVEALALMATEYPDQVPISKASGIFLEFVQNHPEQAPQILLDQYALFGAEPSWSFGNQLVVDMDERGNELILVASIVGQTDSPQSIALSLELKRGSAYVLELEVRSFAPFVLGGFPQGQIADSFPDGWQRSPEWTEFNVVFVTPDWPMAKENVLMEIARVYDRGEIWLRNIRLFEVEVSE